MVRNHNLERDYLVYLHDESYEDDLNNLPGLYEEDDEE